MAFFTVLLKEARLRFRQLRPSSEPGAGPGETSALCEQLADPNRPDAPLSSRARPHDRLHGS